MKGNLPLWHTRRDSIPFAQSSPLALGARSMLVSHKQPRLISGSAGQHTVLTFGSFATWHVGSNFISHPSKNGNLSKVSVLWHTRRDSNPRPAA